MCTYIGLADLRLRGLSERRVTGDLRFPPREYFAAQADDAAGEPGAGRSNPDRSLGQHTGGKEMFSRIHSVTVAVADQDAALDFYVNTLGWEKAMDSSPGENMRWL